MEGSLADAIGTAFREGDGDCAISVSRRATAGRRPGCYRVSVYTERFECPNDGTKAPQPTPALFSFNNPRGACPTCNGFGATLEYHVTLIVPNPERSIEDGAIDPWTKPRYEARRRLLATTARKLGAATDVPWSSLTTDVRDTLLHGQVGKYIGIFPFLKDLERKRYKQYIRVFLRQYQLAHECPACHGARLRPESLAVCIAGQSIADVAALTVDALYIWLSNLALTDTARRSPTSLHETDARVAYLRDVGLGYLSLDRQTRTLSGERHNASPSPTPSARASSIQSMCSTSRRSASTRGTPTASSDCCGACAISAIPSSSSSTTSAPFAAPTG